MASDNDGERREGYGALQADVKNLIKSVDDIKVILDRREDTARADRQAMWAEINSSKSSMLQLHVSCVPKSDFDKVANDVSRIKGVGSVLAAVWSGFIAWLWSARQ